MNSTLQTLDKQLSNSMAAILEQITNVLHSRNFSAFKNLKVEGTNGVVTLKGSTRSFYHKQLAMNHIKTFAGNLKLIDEIAVQNFSQS